jgi:phenylalanyl-tRNA synthetase beta chain
LPKKIKLNLNYVESLLGVKIPTNEIKDILKRLGFKISQPLIVEVPTFRLDINLPEDLIEEIGRIYGFEKIPARPPLVSLIPPERNLDIFWEDFVKDVLKEAGFSEIYNYSFISEKMAKIFGFKNLIEIENPVSLEQKFLRPSLILNLLKNVKDNEKNFKEIKIFELGKIFRKIQISKSKFQIVEKKMLTGLITGEAFFEAKGIIDLLLNKMGISNIWYDEYQPTPEESEIEIWHLKRSAEIKTDNEEIGFLGEISPKILEKLEIEGRVVVFDFDFEKLKNLASEEHEFRPLSKYPAAIRDLAVLVPSETKVEEVLNKIEIAGGSLVRDVDLFDIYEGEEIEEGKKNLAFHIIYQAEDRALSSEEIDKIQEKIIESLEEEPEWQVRR